MKILVVEDDPLQSAPLIETLQTAFTGCEVALCANESLFQSRLPVIVENPPDLVTMDIMLRWDNHGGKAPEGPWRAGFRCIEMMRAEPKLKEVPVVSYTVLERRDIASDPYSLTEHDRFVSKSANTTVLLSTIRELVGK